MGMLVSPLRWKVEHRAGRDDGQAVSQALVAAGSYQVTFVTPGRCRDTTNS
jgi:hypothetical protein